MSTSSTAMSSATVSIRPLPTEVAKQINSSTAIPSLNSVIIGLAKNALDAGAQKLEIDVDYGRGSCTVEDDGRGIPPVEFSENGGLAKSHRELNFFNSLLISLTHTSRYFKNGGTSYSRV